jgi:hypothetical protein
MRNRYALWLVPEDSAGEKLSGLIGTLSERYGGPRFPPHVTLLGWVTGDDVSLSEKTGRLAGQFKELNVHTRGFAGEAYYFRCLYARLEKSSELLAAHELASTTFGAGYADGYLPHVSLAYGYLDLEEKIKLRDELNGSVPAQFNVNRLQLIHITVAIADWRVVTSCALTADSLEAIEGAEPSTSG